MNEYEMRELEGDMKELKQSAEDEGSWKDMVIAAIMLTVISFLATSIIGMAIGWGYKVFLWTSGLN